MKSEIIKRVSLNLFFVCFSFSLPGVVGAKDAQNALPNPLRAVVSTDLEEPYEIYEDGSFEAGKHEIRTVSPYSVTLPPEPQLEWTTESVHSGNRAYKIVNSSSDTVELSLWIDPDKAEEIAFSCWVKSANSCTLRPFMVFESGRLVAGPVYGDAYALDSGWSQVTFTTSTTSGFRFAHAGIEVPPHSTLFIDDVSVTVPVWKEPDSGVKTVGGVNVPAEPVAPVNICFSIHIEDPQNLISDETFFWRKTIVFKKLAELFHEHGGFLNIQPELEWALALERYAPDLLQNLADTYGVTYSTHTHGPVCKGPDGTPYGSAYCKAHHHHHPSDHNTDITGDDITKYVNIRRQKLASLSGTAVHDHNGNFDLVNKKLLSSVGVQTLSVFKSKYTQKSYDALYTNPWRPSNGNAVEDISAFLSHDPDQPLIYIPGVGSNVTKRHHRVPLKVRRFVGQFIKHADQDRVDAMNLVLHVDAFAPADPADDADYIRVEGSGEPDFAFSDEFLDHLQHWDDMLTQTIDPLVSTGYLQWSAHAEIADAFVEWEEKQQSTSDSAFTFIPSTAAAETGVAVRIRMPQQQRFSDGAPVVIYVPGGFGGQGMTTTGAGLFEHGFIELYFNFPGSGLPGSRSGGVYDMRGPLSIQAFRDVIRFALGEIADIDGKSIADLCRSSTPLCDKVGLVGWSNGGNATLAVAGRYATELSNLAWIVNWESPVGDGMPTAEAGDKGYLSSGNPAVNPAYDPDSGEWDLNVLQYDASINVNQHHASQTSTPLYGGFYFDINGNGQVDQGIDFVPSPIAMEQMNGDIGVFYSERITNAAKAGGLYPANSPDHLMSADSTAQFWQLRNGEKWLDEIGLYLDHLNFIVVASDSDHVQTAPDHPHILIQNNGLVHNGIALARVNPDLSYVSHIMGTTPVNAVDNRANRLYNHQTIVHAVQPPAIPGLDLRVGVSAACCELADRTYYNAVSPQLDQVITGMSDIAQEETLPQTFTLQCYPNPFNSHTVISCSIPQAGPVRITIFNQLGQRIQTLVQKKRLAAGTYTVNWDGRNYAGHAVASGVYFYQLRSRDFITTQKAVLLR